MILKNIKGLRGKLHLIKNYLLAGDTLSAYYEYQKINLSEIPRENLYPWAIIALEIDERGLKDIISRMAVYPELTAKSKILSMFLEDRIPAGMEIENLEDVRLVQRFLNIRRLDSSALRLPDSIKLDTILSDTTNLLSNLENLKMNFKKNYYLDSIYCYNLIRKGLYKECYNIMEDYINFGETKNFARIARGLVYFQNGDFRNAAKDLVLAQTDDHYIKLIKAECLFKTGGNPEPIYEELIGDISDSLFRCKCMINYFNYKFQKRDYSAIIKFDFKEIMDDSELVKPYLLSLIHRGKMKRAESLYIEKMGGLDLDFYIAQIGYLMENRRWKEGRALLDSLVHLPGYQNQEEIFYNHFLVRFISGDFIIAESLLAQYIKRFKGGKYFYQGLFKMGTLKYMKMDFDSAAYYYRLASSDTLLYEEAMENQLTALKKAQRWHEIIEVGRKLIATSDMPVANYFFEVGYAFLRSGAINEAIENLKTALELEPNVEYHYWLGEAYLGKGDFIRALYQYQKIVNCFEKDKMWYPTALFKSGLALEMLNEMEAAKMVYKEIINKYGLGDIWAQEAQKRLELLK